MKDDINRRHGVCQSVFICTNCGISIVAEIDFDVNGHYVIECPECWHEHCRVLIDGYVTDDRWAGRNGNQTVHKPRHVWKSNVMQAKTSAASFFLWERYVRKQ
jgi:hypothetical protein